MRNIAKKVITGLVCALFLISQTATLTGVVADQENNNNSLSATSFSITENSYYKYKGILKNNKN